MKINQNHKEITLKINGIEVSAIEGTSILNVAKKIQMIQSFVLYAAQNFIKKKLILNPK